MTIYVKKEEEKVYNALMLDSFGVVDLRETVSILMNEFKNHIFCCIIVIIIILSIMLTILFCIIIVLYTV